jgi:RNA polymerase sigma factor (TIGR02999 family)
MAPEPQSVTQLLRQWRDGDQGALDRLFPLVYDELRVLAVRRLRSAQPGQTLEPAALVHEAYLRLAGVDIPWQDRAHFFAMAAIMMRRVLVDHAKERSRLKRGGDMAKISLDEALMISEDLDIRVVLIDEALTKLSAMDTRKARIIEMLYFGGLTVGEVSEAMEISPSTVHRETKFAKAWILHQIT